MPKTTEGKKPATAKPRARTRVKATPKRVAKPVVRKQTITTQQPPRAHALTADLVVSQATSLSSPQTASGKKLDYKWALVAIGVGLLGILLVTSAATFFSLSQERAIQLATIKLAPRKPAAPVVSTQPAPLTCLPVTAEVAARRAWAVVIENFPTARPQVGLTAADVVFESPTEGGITRFLAIFHSQYPTVNVGPIRSARSYFNDWARAFAPFYSHSGGSTKALSQLRKDPGPIQDANEFYFGAAYTRDMSKAPPHNLFTTAEKFMSYAKDHKWNLSLTPKNLSCAGLLTAGTSATSVEVPYSPPEYRVSYRYLPSKLAYERSEGGALHQDVSGTTITATNVVLLYTNITPVANDALKRVELQTTGSGPAILYTHGQQFNGRWVKQTVDSQITFVDSAGSPLPLQPGNTWISVLDKSQAPKAQAAPKP